MFTFLLYARSCVCVHFRFRQCLVACTIYAYVFGYTQLFVYRVRVHAGLCVRVRSLVPTIYGITCSESIILFSSSELFMVVMVMTYMLVVVVIRK